MNEQIEIVPSENNHKPTKKERRELRRQEKQSQKIQDQHAMNAKKRNKIIVIGLILLGVFGVIIRYSATKPSALKENVVLIKTDDWVEGNRDAKVNLVEYLDYECESCGEIFPVVKRLAKEYGNEVSFVTRYFPLPGHKNSLTSALAVEASGKQGKYWEMHDLLFENQRDWGEKAAPDPIIFENYARQIGLDLSQFKRDVNSKEVKERVERDRKTGLILDVQGTPTFFLDGKKINTPRDYEGFKVVIEEAIKNKTK